MTEHIKNRIEEILFGGGIVILSLKILVDILEDIRSVESINKEFVEAFADIEERKGSILQKIKSEIFEYINSGEKYHYPNNYTGTYNS